MRCVHDFGEAAIMNVIYLDDYKTDIMLSR